MIMIKNANDFLSISKGDVVELSNDIDCSGVIIQCVLKEFKGSIDGRNHVIRNVLVDDSIWGDEQKVSLFRHLSHATIKNIIFENVVFKIEKGIYRPCIAGLSCDNHDSELKNLVMNVTTTDNSDIPMIYESVGGIIDSITYSCNGKKTKIFKYKEGSSYERND